MDEPTLSLAIGSERTKKYSSLSELLKKPPVRLKDAKDLRSAFSTLEQADLAAAGDRALILDHLTGGLPFDPAALEEAGRGDATNVNPGWGEDQINNFVSSYSNLIGQDQVMARPVLKPWVEGTPQQKEEWVNVLAKEFTWLNQETWPNFFHYRMRLTRQFIFFGLGFAVFPNERDWRWSPMGLEDVKVQRHEKMSLTDFEMLMFREWCTAPTVLGWLGHDADLAEEGGWNVDAVLESLPNLARESVANRQYDPEFWVRQVKDNDFLYNMADAKKMEVLSCLYKNTDGTIGYAKAGRNPPPDGKEDSFLFHHNRMYQSETDFVVIFAYEIGTGDFGSIRGAGYKLYQKSLTFSRALCLLIDAGLMSSSLMFQAKTENAVEGFALMRYGVGTVMGPNFNFVPNPTPNLGQNVLPVLNQMRLLGETAVGPAQRGTIPAVAEQTATASKLAAADDAELTSAERTNFFTSWKFLCNGQYRRLSRKDLAVTDPGGVQAMEFRKRLLRQGVPMEVILEGVDYWIPTRPVGNGSAAVEQIKLDQLMQLATMLPPAGRLEALRWKLASIVGWDRVEAFVKVQPATPNMEAQMAALENALFAANQNPPVLPGQDDMAHAVMHAQFEQELLQVVGEMEQSGQPPNPQILMTLSHVGDHQQGHLERLASAAAPPPELEGLNKLNMEVGNAVKKMAGQMPAQEEAQPEGQPQIDPLTQQKLINDQALFEQESRQSAALAQQKMELASDKHRQQIEDKQIKTVSTIEQKDLTTAQEAALKQQRHLQEMQQAAGQAGMTSTATAPATPDAGDPTKAINALSTAIKAGVPITALEFNMALAEAGLPPLGMGEKLKVTERKPPAAGKG